MSENIYDSKSYRIEKRTFTIAGCSIITLCVIGLVVCACIYFARRPEVCALNLMYTPQSEEIEVSDLYELESNLQKYVNDCELRLENRYKFYIEQKEKSQDILVICSTIIGIIIALFGFLGYKSLRELEIVTTEKAINNATREATKVATQKIETLVPDTIDKRISDYHDDRLRATITQDISDDIKNNYLVNEIENLREEMIQLIQEKLNNSNESDQNEDSDQSDTSHEPNEPEPKMDF